MNRAGNRMNQPFEVELVPLEWLKTHEEIKAKKYEKLLSISKKWGAQRKPILVDKRTGVILDGHHRHAVAESLGLKRIAVIAINYLDDDSIHLEKRSTDIAVSISKEQVISMGLSEKNFPPKVTKHSLEKEMPEIWVDFSELN